MHRIVIASAEDPDRSGRPGFIKRGKVSICTPCVSFYTNEEQPDVQKSIGNLRSMLKDWQDEAVAARKKVLTYGLAGNTASS